MQRSRSYVCLRCGKQYRVSWEAYQELKRDPICEACRNIQLDDTGDQTSEESLTEVVNHVWSKLNNVIKTAKNNSAEQ